MNILYTKDYEPVIKGVRYNRGRATYGDNRGGHMVGYRIECVLCGWDRRVNAPLKIARREGATHARLEHDLRGLVN